MGFQNMKRMSRSIATIAVLIGAIPVGSAQDRFDQTRTFSLIEENDSFWTGVDRHYTQGIRMAFASGEVESGTRASIADSILFAGKQAELSNRYRYGVYFGQSIFTPENLLLAKPDPHDRPYAGWLYVGAVFYRETGKVLDRAEITVGVVGPSAQGEEVQNKWHDMTRSFLRQVHVNGWGAQLGNEPGVVLAQERKWRIPGSLGKFDIDLLPEVNASVGNVFTYGAAGFLARLGQRISVDWGPPRVQPAISGTDFVNRERLGCRSFAWYLFAGAEGRVVARNIFLDGNSFENGASVQKQPFVADYTAGIAAVFPHGRATFSYVRRTDEFKTQVGEDQFVSMTLAILF